MASEVYATLQDVELLIGRTFETEEQARVNALIEYAALAIRRAYQEYGVDIEKRTSDDDILARKQVNCYVVKRIIESQGYSDITNASTTVGSFTESFTFANPDGSIFMRGSDYKQLGLNRGRLMSVEAYEQC